MPSPPFAIVLTVTFLLILSCFLFHRNWNTVFCNASTRLSGGFGNKLHRWIILDKINNFRTATLPNGVICLFNHTFYNDFISKNFLRKLSSSHSFKLLVNQIPSIFNLGGFQSICKFGKRFPEYFVFRYLSNNALKTLPEGMSPPCNV